MRSIGKVFREHLITRRMDKTDYLPTPRMGNKADETIFGALNLIMLINVLVLVPFVFGAVLGFMLDYDARATAWQVIIYGGLGIWGLCALAGYPLIIVYHARLGNRKKMFLALAAFMALLTVLVYALLHI